MFQLLSAAFVCYCLLVCTGQSLHGSLGELLYHGQISQRTNNRPLVSSDHNKFGITLHVAFSAFLNQMNTYSPNQAIAFDHVLLNHGNGYNPTTGVFTVPISGVYSFEYTIVQPAPLISTYGLFVDGDMVSYGNANAFNSHSAVQKGNSVILEVTKGQKVVLRYMSGLGFLGSPDYGYSTFSGFLLYIA